MSAFTFKSAVEFAVRAAVIWVERSLLSPALALLLILVVVEVAAHFRRGQGSGFLSLALAFNAVFPFIISTAVERWVLHVVDSSCCLLAQAFLCGGEFRMPAAI